MRFLPLFLVLICSQLATAAPDCKDKCWSKFKSCIYACSSESCYNQCGAAQTSCAIACESSWNSSSAPSSGNSSSPVKAPVQAQSDLTLRGHLEVRASGVIYFVTESRAYPVWAVDSITPQLQELAGKNSSVSVLKYNFDIVDGVEIIHIKQFDVGRTSNSSKPSTTYDPDREMLRAKQNGTWRYESDRYRHGIGDRSGEWIRRKPRDSIDQDLLNNLRGTYNPRK